MVRRVGFEPLVLVPSLLFSFLVLFLIWGAPEKYFD